MAADPQALHGGVESVTPGPPTPPERRLRSDVLLMLAAKVIVLGGGVLSSIVVARALGPSGRGLVAVAIGLTMILVQFGALGFQTANPYFLTKHEAPRRQLVANSVWLALGIGLLLALLAIACRAIVPSVVAGLNWLELILAVAGVPTVLMMIFLQGILLAEQRMRAYNAVEAGSALVAITSLIVWEATVGLTITTAIAMSLGGYVVGSVACLVLLRHDRPLLEGPDIRLVARMAGYAGRVYLASLLAYVVVRVDVLLVNGFLGPEEAGYYSLAVGLADMIYLLPLVVAVNLFPRLTRGAPSEMTGEIFRSLAVIYAVVVAITALVAEPAVGILYGAGFEPTASLFWWLAPGAWCYGVLNILNYHLAARGFPRRILVYWTLALALNVAINVALLPSQGTYIASLASSVAYGFLLYTHARQLAIELGGWRMLVPRRGEVSRFVRTALRPAPAAEPR